MIKTIAKALNEGLERALEENGKVLVLGEDIGRLGGVFRVTDGLQAKFGDRRVIDAPLGESAIVGTAAGLAIRGYRTVCEIQFDGFVYPAFDQVVSQVAKLRKRSEGAYKIPLVIRLPFQGGIGAIEHHSDSPEAYFAQTAGIRVVAVSNANDAYWMIQQAIDHDDPIVFCEPLSRYWEKGEVGEAPPRGLFEAAVVGEGSDITLIGWGASVKTMLRARDTGAGEGRSLEVIDARSLSPLDLDTMAASVTKTGRLVVVQEAPGLASVGDSIVAGLTERCFYSMQSPGLTVSGYHVPYPPSGLEEGYRPGVDRILDAVDRAMAQ